MLGIVLIVIIFLIGDALSRRLVPFSSLAHRLAVAFLVGSVFSSVTLYCGAMIFSSTASPLFWANLLFFGGCLAVFLFAAWKSRRKADSGEIQFNLGEVIAGELRDGGYRSRPEGSDRTDLFFLGFFLLFSIFLVYSTLQYSDGSFNFSVKAWSDFGANLSLSQSFALGNNYPTEHPFLSGEPIRYHFLFWFLAANISYLGVNLASSINVLSILSFLSLIVLLMTLAEELFRNRWVGRLAGVFFFLSSSSLSYLAYLSNHSSVASAFSAIAQLRDFVKGYAYRGDDWGSLTVAVYAYQRHLISAVAILILVIIFLVQIYRSRYEATTVTNVMPDPTPEPSATEVDEDPLELDPLELEETPDQFVQEVVNEAEEPVEQPLHAPTMADAVFKTELPGLLLCGLLIGALPYWNSAVFLSAAIVLVALLVLMPARKFTAVVFATAMLVALPQILYLQSGDKIDPQPALFYFGYIVPNPTISAVLEYAGWLFGIKFLLLLVALILSTGFHRRLLIAFTGLVFAVFLFQFSIDVFNNHKLLNVWSVLTSAFTAYAIVRIGQGAIWRKALGVVLALAVAGGSVIDLFPLKNDAFVNLKVDADPLSIWVMENTSPKDIFLSDRHLSHPILFAGRKLFMGNPLFPWAAGYNTPVREAKYRQMFTERDPAMLRTLLKENNISYVAIDDGVRKGGFVNNLNEETYSQNFEKVFADTEKRYGDLSIYRIPRDPGDQTSSPSEKPKTPDNPLPATAFVGGVGARSAEFKAPRGIAVGPAGQIYIADTGNSRVQVFSESGEFQSTLRGFEFGEPNGIAVDATGNIFVTDAAKHKLLKFSPEGVYQAEWPDATTTFYGPRGVAIGPNGMVYVVDQGNSRIAVVDPASDKLSSYWGKNGSGDGEFAEPGGIEIFDNSVYVVDTLNNRIQKFSLDGTFQARWVVPEWDAFPWQFPDIKADPERKRFYVTSPRRNEVLVLGTDGQRLDPMPQPAQSSLQYPAFMAIDKRKDKNRLYVVNNVGSNISFYELGAAKPQATGK